MSAPSSGHGKTAIAVGLLAAMAARGLPTAGFKVGPDHTDAAYLGLAAGRPGRNLDPRLVGAQRIAPLFGHGAAGAQLSVIEGAMGLFDSLTGQPEIDGTAAVAAALRAPVALVVDVAAMGHSLAAMVHGFRMFDEMVHLGGVILNRVASPRHEQMLRSALDDIGMPVLGALRRGDLPNVLPSRAHGLVPVAHRTVEAGRAVRRLGEAVAQSLDLDRLMALANAAPPVPGPLWTPAEAAGEPADMRPVIALAGGPGAPYTYVETAELLTAAGADVIVVDPLRDESLPPGTRALIVGSGLPEGYAEELSANRHLCADVAQFARDGWPVIAEGVALPWLGRDLDGRPMCGVLDITGTTGEQTVAGYREATAPASSVLAPAGARITGYKQHRAVVAPRAGATPAWTWSGGNPEGFVWRQIHASQLGLHWAAAPEIAKRLVAAAIAGPVKPGGPGHQPSGHGPQSGSPMPQPAGHASSGHGPSSGHASSSHGPSSSHAPAVGHGAPSAGPGPQQPGGHGSPSAGPAVASPQTAGHGSPASASSPQPGGYGPAPSGPGSPMPVQHSSMAAAGPQMPGSVPGPGSHSPLSGGQRPSRPGDSAHHSAGASAAGASPGMPPSGPTLDLTLATGPIPGLGRPDGSGAGMGPAGPYHGQSYPAAAAAGRAPNGAGQGMAPSNGAGHGGSGLNGAGPGVPGPHGVNGQNGPGPGVTGGSGHNGPGHGVTGANGQIVPRTGPGSPNAGPVHGASGAVPVLGAAGGPIHRTSGDSAPGAPGSGPAQGPGGVPDTRPTSDIPISS
ncbi:MULTISPECIES: cobyrinate a,c-diamide synthase [unclassified Actinoplanes]|uniref:cobyrinate a,c-diamide synthase n=1 Tax=unclassified Actinoplanes TaxID=2626549 RepID=UPI001E4B3CA2|nr:MULTISPECIES: cobyrinate a,c-diamide synthase [unclassified Actinoplanes]